MALEALIAKYGLLGIFLGSGVEGEAVVVTGGVLAHRGLVPLWAAMIASATGSCIVDQIWFLLGRRCRNLEWVQRIAAKPTFSRALEILEKHPNAFIFGFRFIYGMRTVSPIAIGTSKIPTSRFVVLNALAAAVWGPLFTWLGFEFGRAVDPLLDHLQEWALYIVAAVAVIGVLAAGIAAFLRRRAERLGAASNTTAPD